MMAYMQAGAIFGIDLFAVGALASLDIRRKRAAGVSEQVRQDEGGDVG